LKDIKSDFYINGSSNDDLESEITKDSWRCWKDQDAREEGELGFSKN
jgi:hypothetical protein